MDYTKSEVDSLQALGYAFVSGVLALYGWAKIEAEDSTFRAHVEIWQRAEGPDAAVLVLRDEASAYKDYSLRQVELVDGFAVAEGMSRFEALALLSGRVPWSSDQTKMMVEAAGAEVPE